MIKVLRNIRERRRYLKMDKSGEIYLIGKADHHISRRSVIPISLKYYIMPNIIEYSNCPKY